MTMTVTHMSTAEAVAAMLTEPTGASILDSGDAYGRHWQRNADRGLADWQGQPRARADRWGCVSLSVFHYLTERVEYMPEMDAAWQEWAEAADPDDRQGWLSLADEYAELMHTGDCYGELSEPRSWNTYNGEDALAQVLQGVTYCDDDAVYVLLQIHGGCDVRGGYTRPRVFRVDVDMAAYFPYDHADWTVYCTGEDCGAHWDVRGGYEVTDRDGCLVDALSLEYGEGMDHAPCPECGAALGVDAPYPY